MEAEIIGFKKQMVEIEVEAPTEENPKATKIINHEIGEITLRILQIPDNLPVGNKVDIRRIPNKPATKEQQPSLE